MSKEGVIFHTGVNVGIDIAIDKIIEKSDAVILAGGAEKPRDLEISGRHLDGVHFAMEFLPQQNRRVSGEATVANSSPVLANGKHVVVIGGGDTGSDCIGTSIRQGALSVTQLEIMPKPPEKENKFLTWPNWPLKMRTSSSQEEGAEREFSVMTDKFTGKNGSVSQLHCIRVDEKFSPIKDSQFSLKADLVLLAMGFLSPETSGMISDLGLDLDNRSNVLATDKNYKTSNEKVWVAGGDYFIPSFWVQDNLGGFITIEDIENQSTNEDEPINISIEAYSFLSDELNYFAESDTSAMPVYKIGRAHV